MWHVAGSLRRRPLLYSIDLELSASVGAVIARCEDVCHVKISPDFVARCKDCKDLLLESMSLMVLLRNL